MRFRRSIRLGKGLRLNLSKSGLSLTAGFRGASVNFGPRGTYLNTGIPGTGLYDRKRIDSGTSRSTGVKGKTYVSMTVKIEIDDNGKPIVKDENGSPILDESLLRKIKKTTEFKQKVEELLIEKKKELEDNSSAFVDIFKFTPELTSRATVEQELKNLKPQKYDIKAFSTSRPVIDGVRLALTQKARSEIRSIFFWTLKRKRNEYIESNLHSEYDKVLKQWLSDKEAFESAEKAKQEQEDRRLLIAFESRKRELEDFLTGVESYVQTQIDSFLKSLTLPVEFSINYDYLQEKGYLMVDLDLPEIEDLPKDKANLLASGKLSIKPKTQKESKEDYIRCVIGLAFFFAGSFFNISTNINKILVSGYTQRLNNKSGVVEDQYIYSIVFERSKFAELALNNIDPFSASANFKNIIDVSKSLEMKEIKPLEAAAI
ncbi:MAG: DUF4236 domain-containing protein [Nitrospirota bacterium]|nr:DUF4236 domain-containing protein [Nitrospirota bacterium]